jgi:serine protease AprX
MSNMAETQERVLTLDKVPHLTAAGWGTRVCVALLFLLLAGFSAFGGDAKLKIAKSLWNAEPGSTIDVFVHFKARLSPLEEQRIYDLGGTLKRRADDEKSAAFSLPAEVLEELAEGEEVVSISADEPEASEGGQAADSAVVDPQAKLAPELATVDGSAKVRVIVQYHTNPTDAMHQSVVDQGGEHQGTLEIIKSGVYTVPASALQTLSNDPSVAYISLDRPVTAALDHTLPGIDAQLARSQGFDGTGIGVAVVDSGVTQVNGLAGAGGTGTRIVYSESFIPFDTATRDFYGHGTHVAGVIASQGAVDYPGKVYVGKYVGVAPGVNIINLRVLDQTGVGTDSVVIAAIQRAIQLKNTYNIRVLNLSLGRGVYESYKLDPLCQAVEAAWKAGIVVVVAAGNSGRDNSMNTHGYATIGVPANDPYVITVGATNMHGGTSQGAQTTTSYSSKGPTLLDHILKPDVMAPGNLVVSLYVPSSTLGNCNPNLAIYPCDSTGKTCNAAYGQPDFMQLSGTSISAPAVSAAAALLLERNPNLTPDQVKARLMKTAFKSFPQYYTAYDQSGQPYSIQSDVFSEGAGVVDVMTALSNSDLAPATYGAAKSPQVALDSQSGNAYIVPDPSTIWGNAVLWGTSVVWGTAVFPGTGPLTGDAVLWGNSVVWGTTTSQGFAVIWGTSVVWGTTTSQPFAGGVVWDSQ